LAIDAERRHLGDGCGSDRPSQRREPEYGDRLSLAYTHDAYMPYTPLNPGTQASGEPVLLFPTITRLQGFVGLQYDIGS
jgi:hypothetical protein